MRVPRADINGPQTGEKIVILGGGITGLTVAWELSKNSRSPVL
jgi:glycine/D-amino acid oxidase-like deaminating enzyme